MSEAVTVDPSKREEAVKVLAEIFGHMEVAARLDAKDVAEGAISIAVELPEAVPGVLTGKRSPFSDALQYLVNKRINRPGAERRHVMVGIGAHPEPRAPKPQRGSPANAPAPANTPAKGQVSPPPRAQGPAAQAAQRPPAGRVASPAAGREPEERSLEVEVSPALAQEVKRLTAASASFGRYFALMGLGVEDRARVLKAAGGAPDVTVKLEGEGRNRRVVLTPAKPVPLPRQRLPVEDIEDLEDEAG